MPRYALEVPTPGKVLEIKRYLIWPKQYQAKKNHSSIVELVSGMRGVNSFLDRGGHNLPTLV